MSISVKVHQGQRKAALQRSSWFGLHFVISLYCALFTSPQITKPKQAQAHTTWTLPLVRYKMLPYLSRSLDVPRGKI